MQGPRRLLGWQQAACGEEFAHAAHTASTAATLAGHLARFASAGIFGDFPTLFVAVYAFWKDPYATGDDLALGSVFGGGGRVLDK